MKKNILQTVKSLSLILLLLVVVVNVLDAHSDRFQKIEVFNWMRLKRVHIENETSGVLNIASSLSNIGDVRTTGITKTAVFDFGNDTFGDQWVPARADTNIGILFNGDVIIDSIAVLSTFGSGDTAVVNTYKTDLTDSTVTTLSGPDTLVSTAAGYQSVDLTGVAAATRDIDISGLERLAIHVDEHGTLEQVSVFIWYREYDAQ